MAVSIPPEHDRALSVIEGQLRECFGRVAYSHKTHEKAADACAGHLRHIKLVQIILSAIVTGGLIATFFGDAAHGRPATVLSAILSAFLLALNAYTKDADPGRTAQKHKDAADKLWSIRESYLSLLTDARAGNASLASLQVRRDELQARLEAVYAAAPRTGGEAYSQAGKALTEGEELTFSDEEIDRFLPKELRRSK